jgi:transcriptional regulator with XRE-family HTH domain
LSITTNRDWVSIEIFAANLRRLMTFYGLSNADLSKLVGVSREVVRQWRNGDCLPTSTNMRLICEHLKHSVTDLTTPLHITNLNRLMTKHGFDVDSLARHLKVAVAMVCEWMNGNPPSTDDAVAICDYIKHRHGVQYTTNDIFGLPDLLPLRAWARREAIPVTRAKALFELQLLAGAVESSFGLLIPSEIIAPDDSKRLVSLCRRRPEWGILGLDGFHHRLNGILNERGISNTTLADGVDVNLTTVSHWRTGERTPDEANMQKIAKVCGCKIEDLIFDTDTEAEEADLEVFMREYLDRTLPSHAEP